MTSAPSCCHKVDEEFNKLTNRENTAAQEQTHVTSDLACQKKKRQTIMIMKADNDNNTEKNKKKKIGNNRGRGYGTPGIWQPGM